MDYGFVKNYGVDRVEFYYNNSPLLGNVSTVCILIGKNDEIISRGVAIRSLEDQHNKQVARKHAFDRAFKALKNKKTDDKLVINTYERKDLENYKIIKTFKTEFLNSKPELKREISEYAVGCGISSYLYGDGSKVAYHIPCDTNVWEASKTYRYKSEYQPYPLEVEMEMAKSSGR